jgi:hypothetical protein
MHYLYSFCTGNGKAPATEYQNLTSLSAELVNGLNRAVVCSTVFTANEFCCMVQELNQLITERSV